MISDQRSGGKKKEDPSEKMTFTAEFLCHSRLGDFNRLEDSAPNCELSTVNCKPVFLTPVFTTTLSAIVCMPTFSSWRERAAEKGLKPIPQGLKPVLSDSLMSELKLRPPKQHL